MATAHLPEPAPPGLRPSRFSHLVLQTPNFPAMTAWYKTVLSATPMFENGVVCFLSYDEEHHRLMIGRNPNVTPRDPQAAGVVHFAYAVETLEDLANYYLRLKRAGITPATCINHGFTTSIYYLDPDGNEVELFVDNPAFDWKSDASWMEAPAKPLKCGSRRRRGNRFSKKPWSTTVTTASSATRTSKSIPALRRLILPSM